MNGNNINRVVAIENEYPGSESLGILALWSRCSIDSKDYYVVCHHPSLYLSVLISAQCILSLCCKILGLPRVLQFICFNSSLHLFTYTTCTGKNNGEDRSSFLFIGWTLLMEKYSGISIVFQLCSTSPVWAGFVLDDVIHAQFVCLITQKNLGISNSR